MATIGQFRPVKDGYEGTISTLSMARKVRFIANDNKKGDLSLIHISEPTRPY